MPSEARLNRKQFAPLLPNDLVANRFQAHLAGIHDVRQAGKRRVGEPICADRCQIRSVFYVIILIDPPSREESGSQRTLRWREMDSNFRYRGRRPASGRSLRAQRVETDAAKREFGSDSCLFSPPWGGSGGLGGGLCFPFPTPGNGQQEGPAGADRAPSSARCASNRLP